MNRYLLRARDAIDRTAGRLTLATIAAPCDGKWSIAQILEHLTLAFTANAAAIDNALASGTVRARAPTVSERLARVLVVDVGYFPAARAPEMTLPTGVIPPEKSITTIHEGLMRLDQALTDAAQRFGERTAIVNHPYFAGLTAPQWRKFHWRHTVHHMQQVRARTAQSAPT